MSDIYIFCGHLGSGKTEVSLNFALNLEGKVSLCDLDFVNPYFRSREKSDILKRSGIELISSNTGVEQADIPGLSSKTGNALLSESAKVVLDVGGDDKGARVLGALKDKIAASAYRMFLVLNPYRSETDSEQGVSDMIGSIEQVSGLRFDSIVFNPNYSYSTTLDDVKSAVMQLESSFDKKLQKYVVAHYPVSWLCALSKLVSADREFFNGCENKGMKTLKIDRLMKNPWEF